MSSPSNPVETATPKPAAPAPAAPGAAAPAPAATAKPAGTPEPSEASVDRMMKSAVRGPASGREPTEAELDAMVNEAMGDLSPDALTMKNLPSGRHRNEGGGLKRGRITRVTAEDVFVDLGGKSEGVLPKAEFDDLSECTVGKDILVAVAGFDKGGTLLLSKRAADGEAYWRSIKVGDVAEGLVTGMNKGGLELKIGAIRAFMPASQCDTRRVADISVFLNQKMNVEVTRIDQETREIVVSRRAVAEREQAEQRKRLMNELVEGQVRTGTVRSIMEFGAFVDLGGADGLLHISDLSYARVRSVNDFLKVGDVLEVKILKVDREKEKISLGLKQKKADPWIGIEERYPVGSKFKGRVVRLAPFGAFVELEEGVDGLVHISEMSWLKRINHPSDLVKEGNIVEAVILKIDTEKKEVKLGMKQVEANPWDSVPAKYPPQSIQPGKVVRTSEFGAFIELEPGIEGLAHISELSDKRVNRVTDVVKPGAEVKVRVLSVDTANRRISLSIKQAVEVVPPPPPKPLTPEEIAAAEAKAKADAAAKAAADAALAKKREKLRGGIGGGLGKIQLKG